MDTADLDDDAAKIKFVTNGNVYLPPAESKHGRFMVVFGELAERVQQRGCLTLPFVAVVRRPDASALVIEDAELDFAFHPESSGGTDTVILRGIDDQSALPKGSVIVSGTPAG